MGRPSRDLGGADVNEKMIEWNPTPAQMAAYMKREIEMCRELRKKFTHRIDDTLFSFNTWVRSQQ